MNPPDPNYTVGRGKPPLHTRFQKGQSGNPSGKPGPAKLARQRFQRALSASLERNLDGMIGRLTEEALNGKMGAMKLILSELDEEIAREEDAPAGGSTMEAAEKEGVKEDEAEPPPVPDYALWCKANPGE